MFNIMLTITAAPELVAIVSNFANSITSAKVVTVPQAEPKYTTLKDALEQFDAEVTYNQAVTDSTTYQVQESAVQAMVPAQQPVQNPGLANINQIYNQVNAAPVNPINSQPNPVPVNAVQATQQVPVQAPAVQTSTVPTSAPAYTMEQLAVAATQLVDAGRRAELVNLLNTFGVQALTVLPKGQYGAFATQLRALGAKI
jgi:hypothetical protein